MQVNAHKLQGTGNHAGIQSEHQPGKACGSGKKKSVLPALTQVFRVRLTGGLWCSGFHG